MYIIKRTTTFHGSGGVYSMGDRHDVAFLCQRHGVQFYSPRQDFALMFEAEYLAQEVKEAFLTQRNYGRTEVTYDIIELKAPPAPPIARTRGDLVEAK